MKDMFDCLEETTIINVYQEQVFLVRRIKNKRHQKLKYLYLKHIDNMGNTEWSVYRKDAVCLIPYKSSYYFIRDMIRKYKVSCQIYREYLHLRRNIRQNTRQKEKWWDRIKVWFSRKVTEFMTIPIDSSLP